MIKLSREDLWVAYVLFLTNRKQFLRSVYVYVVFWTLYIFGRGKNASDEIIWRTPCSTSADPLGVADPRLKTSALKDYRPVATLAFPPILNRHIPLGKWEVFESFESLPHAMQNICPSGPLSGSIGIDRTF